MIFSPPSNEILNSVGRQVVSSMKKLKVGDLLTAKDVCLMDTGKEALIVGKQYPIVRIEGNSLFIISEGDLIEHEFYFDYLDEFFTI